MLEETQIKSLARDLARDIGQNYDSLPVYSQDMLNNQVISVIKRYY